MFSTPQVNLYSEDVVRSVEFYRGFGFEETFRTPLEGDRIHVELEVSEPTLCVVAKDDLFRMLLSALASVDAFLERLSAFLVL